MKGRVRIAASMLVLVAACGNDASPAAAKAPQGSQLFANQGCALCHAADGAGTTLGPALQGKKKEWTREKLVQYLKDPIAYTEKDPRLSAQAKKYALPMARFDKLTAEELSALADFVLGLP